MALNTRQIAELWVKQGGDPKFAELMARIAKRESGGRPGINNRGLNKNGTVDWGLYQVNDIWRKDPVVGPLFRSGKILTPQGATKAAIHIFKVQGPRAWATYNPSVDRQYLGGFKSATTQQSAPAVPKAPKPVVDNTQQRLAALSNYAQNPFQPGASTDLALGLLAARTPPTPSVRSATPSRPSRSAAASTPATRGRFTIFGGNPGRVKPAVVKFAERVAAVYGHPLRGDSGATHSKFTVNGKVSDHWSGNATDIPATGKTLLAMGRAALIAAGMPRAQAMKQTGGLYNVNGHQIIFLTMEGGNHYTHLHISAH